MKNIILFTIIIFIGYYSFSQDLILNTNTTIITAKILEVDIETITYKKTDNIDGPTYKGKKSDIIAIKYKNGYVDVFQQELYQSLDNPFNSKKEIFANDSLMLDNVNEPHKNFVLKDFIKFSIVKQEDDKYLVVDFTKYDGYEQFANKIIISFKFIDDLAGGYSIKAYYKQNKIYKAIYRFSSPAAKTRYERIMESTIGSIRIKAKGLDIYIELSEDEQEAIKELFTLSYPK